MIRTPPQHNTMFPPGQIVHHLEVPLTKAVEDYRDDQLAGLVRRVQQLEKELKYVRGENLRLYLELQNKDKNFSTF